MTTRFALVTSAPFASPTPAQEPVDLDMVTRIRAEGFKSSDNMDLYGRVHPSDVKPAAMIVASFAYHLGLRDAKLPRKPLPAPRRRSRRP
jgi:hypothetical protein